MQIPFPACARAHTHLCWLDTRHTFAPGSHFRAVREVNETRVTAGEGFDAHPDRDVDILTWVLSGALVQRDDRGGSVLLQPGELHRLGAGSGLLHGEQNASATEPVHYLRFAIDAAASDVTPCLDFKLIRECDRRGRLQLVAAPDGRDGSLRLHRDVEISIATLGLGDTVIHLLGPERHGLVYVARGSLGVNGRRLGAGDALAVCDEERITLASGRDAEVFVFDVG